MEQHGRVLVVGDIDADRATTLERLRGHGYDPAEVPDARAVLEAARERRPDAVLLDLDLSEADAFDLLVRLREDPLLSDIPVVAITVQREVAFAARVLIAGAHDYLRKPVQETELIARVAAAVRTKELHDTLRATYEGSGSLTGLDDLTGVFNRRALDDEISRQIARATRYERPLSVLLVDLDGFREVNEQHGTEFGDALLSMCAKRLRQRARAADVVGRWRQDRFMIIAPDIEAGGAAVLADGVRSAIARPSMALSGRRIGMTASVGWAQWDGEDAAALVARCERALAEAKGAGRDAARGAE